MEEYWWKRSEISDKKLEGTILWRIYRVKIASSSIRIDSTSRHPTRDVAKTVCQKTNQLHSSAATRRSRFRLLLGSHDHIASKFLLSWLLMLCASFQRWWDDEKWKVTTSHFTAFPLGEEFDINHTVDPSNFEKNIVSLLCFGNC